MTELSLFDYNELRADEAQEVRAAAERIRVRMKRSAEDIVAIGLDLISVKQRLPHGGFLPWIDAEFGMGERAARNFMAVGERYSGKSAIIADLTPTVLYELAAPSTPEPLREAIESKVEAGESVSVEEVKRLKREAADAAKRAEAAEQDAAKHKARAEDLLDGQTALVAQAKREAENAASQRLLEAEQRAQVAEQQLASAGAEHTKAIEDAEAKAMALAKAEAANLAKAELDKLRGAVDAAKKEEADARARKERQAAATENLKKKADEYRTFNSRMENSDLEAKALRECFEGVNKTLTMALVEVADIEHQHGEEVARKARVTAQLCRQFADSLVAVCVPAEAPKMKVVSND